MRPVNIRLLGSFGVAWPDQKVSRSLPARAQACLAYLVLHPSRQFRRDILAGTFWADSTEERARASLRSALWRLRRVLEPAGVRRGTYLHANGSGDVAFNGESDYDLDVAAFEKGIEPAMARADRALTDTLLDRVHGGLEHYAGDLLEGFDDDWILPERERLRCAYLTALTCEMHNLKLRGRYEAALACGRRILTREPLRESIHREMMRLYVHNGERAQALRYFSRCAELLERELGVKPMPETRALYDGIRTQPLESQPTESSLAPVDAQRFLDRAIDDLAHAIREVHMAAARVTRYSQRRTRVD